MRAINEAGLDDGSDISGDVLEDARTQFDVNVRYNVTDEIQIYFDAINITDAEDNLFFRGNTPGALNTQGLFATRENYGATYQMGIRARF